jgi:hypothetical protein
VCKLLATSNAMCSAVHSHCSGQLAVTFDCSLLEFAREGTKCMAFWYWLVKHSGLLKALLVFSDKDVLNGGIRQLSKATALESFGSDCHGNTRAVHLCFLPDTLLDLQIVLTQDEECWDDDDGPDPDYYRGHPQQARQPCHG